MLEDMTMTQNNEMPSQTPVTKTDKKTFPLRTYIVLLLLFCLCLNSGLFALAHMTYKNAYDREVQSLMEDGQALILMTGGYLASSESGSISVDTTSAVLSFLTAKNLGFSDGVNWEGAISLEGQDWTPPVYDSGSQVTRQTVNGNTYLCYAFRVSLQLTQSDRISAGAAYDGYIDDYITVYPVATTYYLLRNIHSLEKQHQTMTLVTALASLVLSVLYAVVSWVALRRYARTVCEVEVAPSENDETVAAPLSPVPRRQAHNAPQNDLGLLCRQLLERFADEADERGIELRGSAQVKCLVKCDTKGLNLLTERLIRLCLASLTEGGRLTLLVTKAEEAVTLKLTADAASLPENALADCRQLSFDLGGELTAEGGTVSVTWEPKA